jgi:hypothetical protein
MIGKTFRIQSTRVTVLALFFFVGACASNAEKDASATVESGPTNFEEQTAKVAAPRCPAGYMLTCEAGRTGRIRFGRMKPADLESCSCEPEGGMPSNSPLPGIY